MYAFSQRMAGLYEETAGESQLCEVIQSVIETLKALNIVEIEFTYSEF
uniref:Uncharacterized protein n=1 Tax=Parascaris equorum TaxID=6256 RepID=A0A914RLU6_PAREQ